MKRLMMIVWVVTIPYLFPFCATTTVVYPGDEEYQSSAYYDDTGRECKPRKKKSGSIRDRQRTEQAQKDDVYSIIDVEGEDALYGIASWYGADFDGKKTASGEIFRSNKLTAAHKTLPLGSVVSVRNLENEKEVVVRINDRGPYVKDRILDLSERGSEILDFKTRGLTQVNLKILKRGAVKSSNSNINGATYEYYGQGGLDEKLFPVESSWVDDGLLLPGSVPVERKGKVFRVQIGSYSNLANARYVEHAARKKFNYPVIVQKRKKSYVVKIGTFPNRQIALKYASRLAKKGYGVFITR